MKFESFTSSHQQSHKRIGFIIIDVNDLKSRLDTIFYRKAPEVRQRQHFVSSSDSMRFERNLMESYRELDKTKWLLDTIFYRKSPKVTGREFDKPKPLLDTIFYRKSLKVTGANHFVSSSDSMRFERNLMESYRELDKPERLLDTIFYRKSLEVTGANHFVSSSDSMGFEKNLMESYRELDKTKRLLDTSAWGGHSKWQGENSTRPNDFSIHPLEADTRSDRARIRQR